MTSEDHHTLHLSKGLGWQGWSGTASGHPSNWPVPSFRLHQDIVLQVDNACVWLEWSSTRDYWGGNHHNSAGCVWYLCLGGAILWSVFHCTTWNQLDMACQWMVRNHCSDAHLAWRRTDANTAFVLHDLPSAATMSGMARGNDSWTDFPKSITTRCVVRQLDSPVKTSLGLHDFHIYFLCDDGWIRSAVIKILAATRNTHDIVLFRQPCNQRKQYNKRPVSYSFA